MTAPRTRMSAAVVAIVVAASVATSSAAAASPATGTRTAPRSAAAAAASAQRYDITLITGDVVHATDLGGGKLAVDVDRPHGMTGGVHTRTVNGQFYVVPDEATRYLASGLLDPDLFDVTELIADRYDDRHAAALPTIVSYTPVARGARSAPAMPAGTHQIRALGSVGGAALSTDKAHAGALWRQITSPTGGVAHVWLDGLAKADLAESTAQIGAPAAWAAGYTGAGVKVAVLDTGIDLGHLDLAGRVSATQVFVPGEDITDNIGHGTHVASTVGGSGAASGGVEKGVAPGADLIVGKVLGDDGFGQDSWIIAGMQWAASSGAKIVSMSLGSNEASDGTDPMSQAVDTLSAQYDTLFVIAAGNSGPGQTVSSPAAASSSLAVAAVDNTDAITWFSSQGPLIGNFGMKPDISAPGQDILAAKAGGNATDGWYTTMSGTSMATPHVAGAAADLAQEHPDWSAAQLKAALMSTSKDVGLTQDESGAGRVDLAAAVAAKLTGPGSAYFGFFPWPHTADSAPDQTLTYTNSGDTDVTVHLSEQVDASALPGTGGGGGGGGPAPGSASAAAPAPAGAAVAPESASAGGSAPAGMFGLSADTLTVPAHGTASVAATADAALGAAGTRYTGQVTATDDQGDVLARTQVALAMEDERYNLTVDVLGRDGAPAGGYLELLQFGNPVAQFLPVDPTAGELRLRLPVGTYSAMMYLTTAGAHGPDSGGVALLGNPELALHHDTTLTLDARAAHQITAVVPKRTEDRYQRMEYYRSDGQGDSLDSAYLLPVFIDTMYAAPTKPVTQGSFEYLTRWRKAAPLLTVTAGGTDVPLMVQAGSVFGSQGSSGLDAVYAGTGTPAELAAAHVAGRAVIVTNDPAADPPTRTQAAADAGAKLEIVVNDQPGKLSQWVGTDTGYSAIPVASVTRTVGTPLIARAGGGRLRLKLLWQPQSAFMYDLIDVHPGAIPAHLTYRPGRDLARVDTHYNADHPVDGSDFRWDLRPYTFGAIGFNGRNAFPATRVDWVSTPPGTQWHEQAWLEPQIMEQRSGLITYRPGSTQQVTWFAPVQRARLGTGAWQPERFDFGLSVNVTPWTDNGADHAGFVDDGSEQVELRILHGSTLLADVPFQATWATLPDNGTHRYTVDLAASRDPGEWRLTTSNHTVWKVVSGAPDPTVGQYLLPMLQLDYGVRTDVAGNATHGRQTITLGASHMPGVVGGGKVTAGWLRVSYDDGRHWIPVPLSGAPGHWTASFTPPAGARLVSLRAFATDDRGNSVTQEVIRAYGLK